MMNAAQRTDDPNARPTLDEQYSTACSASNLRVEADRRGPADHIIAAGLNADQLGVALQRLRMEWDTAAKPPPMTPELLESMAGAYPRLESGLVRFTEDVRDEGGHTQQIVRDVKPLFAAQTEADRWMANELRILMQGLPTLPYVRRALYAWVTKLDPEGAHAVGAAICWWLDNTCPHCMGTKTTADYRGKTGKHAKPCKRCDGSGQRRIPHGPVGRRLISFIWSRLGEAKRDRAQRL
jgi:hypothetical protein